MKILFIHPFLPYPLTSGGHQALYNGIKAVKDDVDITLVYEAIDNEAHRKAREEFQKQMPNVRLKPLLHQPIPEYIPTKEEIIRGKIRNLYRKVFHIKGHTPQTPSFQDVTAPWKWSITPNAKDWVEHIYKVSHEEHFDIIQVEMPWRISDVYAMPKNSKVIFVHHELGFVRRELELKDAVDNHYLDVCRKFVDANEVMQLNLYDAVVTLSATDKQKLESVGVRVPIYSSFAIIDTFDTMQSYSGDGKHLTFIGPDSHDANLIGLSWFLENCWHKLRSIDPEYSLDIIGNWSSIRREEFSTKYTNLKFWGYVDDLRSIMKDHIMIVPITIGSGIRMKILEACSMGVPFVSTTIGAEGIPVKSGEHCFLADNPERFIQSIVQLQDNSIAAKFCCNSYSMVQNNYSIASLRENRTKIYDEISPQKF